MENNNKLSQELKDNGWVSEWVDGIRYTYNKKYLNEFFSEEKADTPKQSTEIITFDLNENNSRDETK